MLQHLYTARCYSQDSQKMIASAGAGTFCGSSARTFVRYEGHLDSKSTGKKLQVKLILIRSQKICTLYNIIHVVLHVTMDLLYSSSRFLKYLNLGHLVLFECLHVYLLKAKG